MIDEAVLEERLTKLEAAKNWSPRVVSRLETLIRSGPDEAVFRINPIRFAAERGIAENEAIDLFLHATLAGVVEMDWLLYCPVCSDVVANFRSLRAVHNQYHCHLCQADYEATLDDYIAVTFTVQPAVRSIRYHDPDSLAAEDYAYYYKGTTEGLTEQGVQLIDLMRSVTRGLWRLRRGEAATLELEVEPGALLGFDMESDASFRFEVSGDRHVDAERIPIVIRPGACAPNGGSLTPGPVVIELRSENDRAAIFGVLHPQDRHSPRGGDRRHAERPPRLFRPDRQHRLARAEPRRRRRDLPHGGGAPSAWRRSPRSRAIPCAWPRPS